MYRKYKCSDSYMMRSPISNIESLDKAIKAYKNKDIIIDDVLVEALESATHNLIVELDKNTSDKEIQNSLLKYIIRSTTRSTPYGLLSGISVGKFDKNTEIIRVDASQNIKRCRVDMEWLCSLISKLEKNEQVFEKIGVVFNDQCIIKGDRIYNPYITTEILTNNQEQDMSVSIKLSEMLLWIKKECSNTIIVKDLVEKIVINSNNISRDKVLHYIKQLIENGLLITELRIPLVNTDPLTYIIQVLERRHIDKNIKSMLENIKCLITEYNLIPIGEGRENYKAIVNRMQLLQKRDNYLQTDLKILCTKNKLSYHVKRECEKVLNFFSKISAASEADHLNTYKNDFVEKYGYHRVVPLMEMLDNDIGIGIPAGYTGAKCYRNLEQNNETILHKKIKEYILYKVQLAMIKGEKTIEIIDADIDNILSELNVEPIMEVPSVDIFVEILANDFEDIDKNNFRIVFSGASICDTAGRAWGRFSDMIDKSNIQWFKEKEQEILEEGYVFASLCEFSRKGRVSNVTMNSNDYEYQISFNTNYSKGKQEIRISDIGIGIDSKSNKFFAYSYSLQKKLKIMSNNMLNPNLGSDAFRFLRDIASLEQVRMGSILSLLRLTDYSCVYTPRIIYSKTILAPATWIFDKNIFSKKDNWKDVIKKIRNDWEIEQFVYIVQGDNKLLIDLDNDTQLELLQQIIKKTKGKITLLEAIDVANKFWIKDNSQQHYANEFVFSLYPERVSDLKISSKFERTEAEGERILFPGQDNWIYLKLYYCEERINDILGNNILNFLLDLKKKHFLEKYFFIRYGDPLPHIRLRIRAESENVLGDIFQEISCWIKELKKRGIVHKVQYDTYEREIERYGGFLTMNFSEKFFFYDSVYVNCLIKLKQENTLSYSDEFIGIVSVFSLMKIFISDEDYLLGWLSNIIDRKDFRSEYKEQKSIVQQALIFTNVIKLKQEDWIVKLNERNQILQQYISEIELNGNRSLIESGDLMGSLIHMFCNRYMGDNVWEKKVKALIRHSLFEQSERKKHFKG